ncbi:PLU-1-like protein-domain-containing protein [Cytidiella melzeri]|nr:PLU-1-like protein-domain-containing protein [Cytidiella melzeri]
MHSGPPSGGSPTRSTRRGMSRAVSDYKAHNDISGRSSTATFTTCLDIKVEGALPIDKLESSSTGTTHKDVTKTMPAVEPKRAPRKSKTDAIAALSASVAQEESANESSNEDVGVRVYLRDGPSIPVSPMFHLSTVKTPYPRLTPSKAKERPFGLTDCPTFRPTPEQFKDPMAYIKSISENAKSYGMCKIVPPLGWAMPFVTDTESFRFKTRLQRLNSIEASSRAKVSFLEQLYRFHKQEGNPRVSVPTINHKPLDLWLLRKEVQKLGGYDAVTKHKKWADLGRLLGYGGIPGLATQMKNSYARVILPWENRYEQHVNNPSSPQKRTSNNGASTSKPGTNEDSPPSSPLTATSSPLSEPPDDSDMGRLRRSARQVPNDPTPSARRMSAAADLSSSNGSGLKDRQLPAEPHCELCHKKDRGEEMLLCDGCDCGFHTFCLSPPLASIPKGQWFCHTCLFGTGSDFGFDEGEEHCLSSFQARDLEFRRLWFTSHPPSDADGDRERIYDGDHHTRNTNDPAVNKFGDIEVSETDVEREFWRLVQSPNETVEVEYGADVHSTTHGSGMPTMETHPLNSYSKDPWNLNNIPILPESLLRFIKSDISGMTVPWTYVGMIFSTFCWHNEDHYTYSVNYMHWGETKTWYSIPGEDAGKFEAAIRREAPELFEAQPDLLFQLVTLMNPGRLKEAGVEVYACNQRAGEFVVTFPKAYHAGFNHGLNFNEAVNFALPDWLPLGLDCVRRYQEHKKLPVFSHDELIITITQQSQSIKTAIWLNDSLKEMVDRELNARARARALNLIQSLEEQDRPEEQYQCAVCKVFCYLSQITCSVCPNRVVCIDHVDQICKCPKTNLLLRKRFDDAELQDTHAKVAERADIPTDWKNKLSKALSESARPSLRTLRALLAEGDRISYPLSELHALRKCVTRANEWVDAANSYLIRKPTRKRPRRRGRLTIGDVIEETDKSDRSIEDLYGLLREVEGLGFDCQEILALQDLTRDAEETKAKARKLLDTTAHPRDRDSYIQECERLMTHGSTLNVHVQDLLEIEKLVLREQLLKELEQEISYDQLSLEDVRMLVSRARSCGLPSDNKYMKLLDTRLRAGSSWEERARDVLEKPQRTLQELEEVTKIHPGVPFDQNLLENLLSARTRGKEIERQITAWMSAENLPSHQRPRVQDVVKLVSRGEKEFSIPVVADMRRTVDFAVDLEARCDSVLKNRYSHTEESDIFQTIYSWKAYAKEHMTIFSLPNFERLEKQLTLHFRWREGLPWYCRSHQQAHGKPVLDDVVESTRPEDDLPPTDEYFTCICTQPVRPPAIGTVSDAVQCDHCYARFHGVCAANGGSCPFCDHQHWNGTIHKERSWHFCYMPTILLHAPELSKNYSEDWKQLEIIVHRVDRLSGVIGQFLAFASQPTNQRAEYIPQVRHYMRKLYKIQFTVSPNPELSFGLELAGLHRVLAGQPTNVRMKKRRRPKFTFGQDVDKDWADGTRCICRGRTAYLLQYPTVECEVCGKTYHGGCVFFPIDSSPGGNNRFMCPLCCLRKNRTYPYSEVRVKHIENPEPDAYVDTKEMLDTFSKDIIYMKMPPPYTQTLFVELIRFTPGQPDSMNSGITSGSGARHMASSSSANHTTPASHRLPHHQYHGQPIAPRPPSPVLPYEPNRPPITNGQPHVPPPPPWSNRSAGSSRWSNAAATAPPPTARSHAHDGPSPTSSPTLQSRKRKYLDENPTAPPTNDHPNGLAASPTPQPSPKRRSTIPTPPMHAPTMPPSPMHPPAMHVPVHPSAMMHPQSLHPSAMSHPSLMHPPPHMHGPPPHVPIAQHPAMAHQGPPSGPMPLIHMQPGAQMQPLRTPPMQPMQAANARTSQGLSPSLAMMLSPNPADVAVSPQRQIGPQYPARANMPPQPVAGPSRPAAEQLHIPPVRPKDNSSSTNPRSTEGPQFRWDNVLTSVFQPHNYNHLR